VRATRGESNLIFPFSGSFFPIKLGHGLRLAGNVGNFEHLLAGAGHFCASGQLAHSHIDGAFCMVAMGGWGVFDIYSNRYNAVGGFG
jgi:hypothetical protein